MDFETRYCLDKLCDFGNCGILILQASDVEDQPTFYAFDQRQDAEDWLNCNTEKLQDTPPIAFFYIQGNAIKPRAVDRIIKYSIARE